MPARPQGAPRSRPRSRARLRAVAHRHPHALRGHGSQASAGGARDLLVAQAPRSTREGRGGCGASRPPPAQVSEGPGRGCGAKGEGRHHVGTLLPGLPSRHPERVCHLSPSFRSPQAPLEPLLLGPLGFPKCLRGPRGSLRPDPTPVASLRLVPGAPPVAEARLAGVHVRPASVLTPTGRQTPRGQGLGAHPSCRAPEPLRPLQRSGWSPCTGGGSPPFRRLWELGAGLFPQPAGGPGGRRASGLLCPRCPLRAPAAGGAGLPRS